MGENSTDNDAFIETVLMLIFILLLGYGSYVYAGLFGAVVGLFSLAFGIFIFEYLRKGDQAIEEFRFWDTNEKVADAGKQNESVSFTESVEQIRAEGVDNVEQIQSQDLQRQVEDKQVEGWKVVEIDNKQKRAIMKRSEGGTIGGHTVTGILTGAWTLGLGNVAYSKISKKKNAETIVLRAQGTSSEETRQEGNRTDLSRKLRELKELNDDGIISDEEYDQKKQQILDQI